MKAICVAMVLAVVSTPALAKKAHHHMRKYKRSAVANGARSETSRACSIKANVLHLHGKARKVFRHKCLKKAA